MTNQCINSDIGDWECKDNDQFGQPISHRIRVLGILLSLLKIWCQLIWMCVPSIARPWLVPFEEFQKTNYKSANIVEGQRLHLRCRIIEGYERYAKIEWFKFNESEINNDYKELVPLYDESHSQSGRIHIDINNNRTDATDQTLTIEKVLPSDRFYYVCRASNDVYSVNNTILLRVKGMPPIDLIWFYLNSTLTTVCPTDKLGALWPFLGIVAEVVILCTIIFIYEKRRIKPDFDETENDNNTEP